MQDNEAVAPLRQIRFRFAVRQQKRRLLAHGAADLKREAEYTKAKSYLATSDRDNAFAIMKKLARETSTPEGAESAYMLIQDSYDKGDFDAVEEQVYALSDSGTNQTYWLAKSFLLLGDTFVEKEDYRQARATFESIRDGYTPTRSGDDVLEGVKIRLDRLAEMEN